MYSERRTTIKRTSDGSWSVTEGGASFTLSDADSNIVPLRRNVVLHSELQPWSTLFLVWLQDRFDMRTSGELVNRGRLVNSLRANRHYVFFLKIAYRLPM